MCLYYLNVRVLHECSCCHLLHRNAFVPLAAKCMKLLLSSQTNTVIAWMKFVVTLANENYFIVPYGGFNCDVLLYKLIFLCCWSSTCALFHCSLGVVLQTVKHRTTLRVLRCLRWCNWRFWSFLMWHCCTG